MNLSIIIAIVVVSIARLIINIIIYRSEYDYRKYTDGVAINFSEEEVAKRDSAIALWALSLFTFFWTKVKGENRNMSIVSNTLSFIFFGLVVSLFLI